MAATPSTSSTPSTRPVGVNLTPQERWAICEFLIQRPDEGRKSGVRFGAIREAAAHFKTNEKCIRSVWSLFKERLAKDPGRPDLSNKKKGRCGRKRIWTDEKILERVSSLNPEEATTQREVARLTGLPKHVVWEASKKGLLNLPLHKVSAGSAQNLLSNTPNTSANTPTRAPSFSRVDIKPLSSPSTAAPRLDSHSDGTVTPVPEPPRVPRLPGTPASLAVFVSDGGHNLKSIHSATVEGSIDGRVAAVVSDDPYCSECQYARSHGIPVLAYPQSKKFAPWGLSPEDLVVHLRSLGVHFVLLAGYLKSLPELLCKAYSRAILSIHPALLPAFGGKGLYGIKVHEAVVRSGAKVSGATIHFVEQKSDIVPIVAQSVVPVYHTDTPEELRDRVLKDELKLYPAVVAALCSGRVAWKENGVPYVLEEVKAEAALA